MSRTSINKALPWQTDKVGDELVNIVEHLVVKEPDISLRNEYRPKTKLIGE